MKMEAQTQVKLKPEWSHQIEVDSIGDNLLELKITAPEAVRKNLASRFSVMGISRLEAEITIDPMPGRFVTHVSGKFCADVTQECAVTLEPILNRIEDAFVAWYADAGEVVSLNKVRHERKVVDSREEIHLLEEEDDPEPIIDGMIDLGELVSQYLSLALTSYACQENAVYNGPSVDRIEEVAPRKNPFAALKEWKNCKKEDS